MTSAESPYARVILRTGRAVLASILVLSACGAQGNQNPGGQPTSPPAAPGTPPSAPGGPGTPPASRTNILSDSENYASETWAKDRVSIKPDAVTAPNGSGTADKMICQATTEGVHYTYYLGLHGDAGKVRDNTDYTFSTHVKAGETPYGWIEFIRSADMKPKFLGFNLSNDSFAWTDIDPVITRYGHQPKGNGWYRVWFTINSGTGSNGLIFVHGLRSPTNQHIFDCNGATGLYLWGSQLNYGAIKEYEPR